MPNGVPKPNEFDATTRVMESGLLRTLADESSDVDANGQTDRSGGPTPPIEVVVAQSVEESVTTTNEPPAVAKDVNAAVPSSPTIATDQRDVAPELPAGRSRVFIVAGIVAAVVLAFDASLFVLHPNRATRPPAAAPAVPEPLPRYMLLPPDSPVPTAAASATTQPAVAPTPVSMPVVAAAIPDAPPIAVREHKHSHHRHVSH